MAKLQREFIQAAKAQAVMLEKIQHMSALGNLREVKP
jgi:hypothetical protein